MTLEQFVGTALVLLFLADIFLTVLYARAGTGLLAPYWTRAIWALLHSCAKLLGRRRGTVLSLAGPLIVVSLIGFWSLGLAAAAALVIQPELGTSIRPSSGNSPTDFITALLVAGNSLSIVGGGDYAPHTSGTRILFLINSLIGASVLSLVLSYLVQVYSALRERNTLALTIDLMTGGTGDAAAMLARLMPGGDADDAASELGNLVRSLAATKEAHHFYPLLFYFRFEEPRYAVSRFTFVLLDLTTLINSGLDPQRYTTLVSSASVSALQQGAFMLLETLDRNFSSAENHALDEGETWRSRQTYTAATRILERAGVSVQSDGTERYIAGRLLDTRYRSVTRGHVSIQYSSPAACAACTIRARCTGGRWRRINRWENEAVLERMAKRLAARPGILNVRRETVEHPFGSIKQWMNQGAFLTRGLEKVRGEFSLTALAYNLRRAITLIGIPGLMRAATA